MVKLRIEKPATYSYRILPLLLAALLASFAATSAARGQASCPQQTAVWTPACKLLPGALCPTQQECNRGWQWIAPDSVVRSLPHEWVRYEDGSLHLQECSLAVPTPQNATPCGLAIQSTTFRVWCQRVPTLPIPPPAPGGLALPPPTFTGLCGTDGIALMPRDVAETVALAPSWTELGPGRRARLARWARWSVNVSR